MYNKDYILRMIEMLAELVAGILNLIKKGEFKQASKAIENAYYDILKEEASFFQRIPKERLTKVLLEEHNYTNGHLEILSELMYTQAELMHARGNQSDSLEYYEKSLLLLKFVIYESKTFSYEKESRKISIENRIEGIKKIK